MPTSCPFSDVSNGHHSRIDPKTRETQMSHKKFLPAAARGSRRFDAVPFDAGRYRTVFPDLWADFLRANYRGAIEVAFNFNVTEQTATNWLNGVSRPTGDKVAIAAMRCPVEFAAAMGVAA